MSYSKLVKHRSNTVKCVFREMTLLGRKYTGREKTGDRETSSGAWSWLRQELQWLGQWCRLCMWTGDGNEKHKGPGDTVHAPG